MQCEQGTSSVPARMCRTNKVHVQCKRGFAVQIRHIIRTSEAVQYEQVDHQNGGGGALLKILSIE